MVKRKHIFGKPFKKLIEYNSYRAMLKRCYNKNHVAFDRYHGRGISVCERWKKSFVNFYKDMGKRPSIDHTLERIDNTKGYYKENCKWATRKEQGNNRRTNIFLTLNGKTMTLTQWSESLGGTRHLVRLRIDRGWDLKRALTTTPKSKN